MSCINKSCGVDISCIKFFFFKFQLYTENIFILFIYFTVFFIIQRKVMIMCIDPILILIIQELERF